MIIFHPPASKTERMLSGSMSSGIPAPKNRSNVATELIPSVVSIASSTASICVLLS